MQVIAVGGGTLRSAINASVSRIAFNNYDSLIAVILVPKSLGCDVDIHKLLDTHFNGIRKYSQQVRSTRLPLQLACRDA